MAATAVGTAVYAALDLGTNNCRLLIACPTGDGFRVVDSFSRIIRLGEGVSATGCISEAAIERAIAALSICRDKIQSKKAKRLRLDGLRPHNPDFEHFDVGPPKRRPPQSQIMPPKPPLGERPAASLAGKPPTTT